MRKIAVGFAVIILIVSLVSLVYAADMKKGTIKGVDAKAGTVEFCAEGTTTNTTLKADKAVDLSKVKVGDKVEVSVEKDMMKTMKAVAKPKAAVGC